MLAAQGIHILAIYTDGMSDVLQLEPVSLEQWLQLLAIATSLIVVDESHKWWRNKRAIKSAVKKPPLDGS